MELRLPDLWDVTQFLAMNNREGSFAYLVVNNKSIRFYSGLLTYQNCWFTDISPNILKDFKKMGIIIDSKLDDGYYEFYWNDIYTNKGRWIKLDDDYPNIGIAEEVFFGSKIKEILEKLEIIPIFYQQASIKKIIFENSTISYLIDKAVIPYSFDKSDLKDCLWSSYVSLFLKDDLDKNYKKAELRTYVKIEPFIFLSSIFDDEIFINVDEPLAPIIFGKESLLNSSPPLAMLFPPDWARKLIYHQS